MTALTSHSTREVNKKTSSLGKPAPDIRACLCAIDASAARLSAADSGIDDWAKHYHQAHRLRLARDLEIVSTRLPESSHILDLGCCPPLLTESLQLFGYTAGVVDIASLAGDPEPCYGDRKPKFRM